MMCSKPYEQRDLFIRLEIYDSILNLLVCFRNIIIEDGRQSYMEESVFVERLSPHICDPVTTVRFNLEKKTPRKTRDS